MVDSVIWLAKDQDQLSFWIIFVNTEFDPMLSWSWSWADFSLILIPFVNTAPGPVFTKGLRLSQVLGLVEFLTLRLLSQLSFVLNPYSQKVT